MPLSRNVVVTVMGVVLLILLWVGPLPILARESFSAHMTLHMGVVAVAAPMLAMGLVHSRWDPRRPRSPWANPVVASAAELVVVWGWHTPALHVAARTSTPTFIAEQATFLAVGVWLWLTAVGGGHEQPQRRWAGVAGLLFTSIHMTLLGSLFTFAPRPLYGADHGGTAALADQHLGGGIMLVVGGLSYLVGGLALTRAGLDASLVGGRRP